MFITIVGIDYYLGIDSLHINQELYLEKDYDNKYDDEAIKVKTDSGVTCGYVANSVDSVARGAHSAGYVYELIKEKQKIKILFITDNKALAKII